MSTISLDSISQQITVLATQQAALQSLVEQVLVKVGGEVPKTKKVKKAKNPDAPKRPANPYINFTNAKRAEVKAANPEAKIGDISKLIGVMWKALTDEQRASYKTVAA